MHAHWKVSLAACTLLLFYGVLASAADMNDCQNPSVMEGPAGIIRTSTLVGTTVLDPQNQALGRIKDVLLDAQTGRASFVVLDAEATHASHAMLVVPYDALRVGSYPAQHRLWVVLDLRPDQVRVAPQISNNQWQMLKNPRFLEQARDFYQIRMYTAARPINNQMAPIPSAQPQSYPAAVAQPPADPFAQWPQWLKDFGTE